MSISLTPEQIQRIQQHLQTGKYANVADVVDEALDLLDEQQPSTSGSRLLKTFEKQGLIGCIPDADPNLSSNYKSIARAELAEQHDPC